jgi:uncharacterized RDD family membrane protein YckC
MARHPASESPRGSAAPGSNAADPHASGSAARGWAEETGRAVDDELVTGEAVALDLRPASFVLRGAGALIDWAVTVLLVIGLLLLLAPALEGGLDPAAAQAVTLALVVVLTVGVPTAVETATQGRSLGKLAVGARIVRDDGGAIGFRHALIRALTGLLELVLTLGGIAVLVGLLNPASRRLGDRLAGTYSRYERVRTVPRPVVALPPELADWAAIADVARMPDRVSRRISQFLRQAPALSPDARRRIADDLVTEASPWVSPIPHVHPETLLAALTALRRDREAASLDRERRALDALSPTLDRLPHGFPRRA